MIEREITLPLGEESSPVRVSVSQFDTMWRFMFTVVYRGRPWEIPLGAGVILNGRKPDGNVFAFDGTVTEGKVAVDCNVQMTAVAGPVLCELSVLSGDRIVGTANFILDVEAAPKSPDDITSETTLPAYGEILDRIAEIEAGSGGGGFVTVDDALSATSENPVQNKAILAALEGKADLVGTALAENADLDTLSNGVYYTHSIAVINSLVNSPIGVTPATAGMTLLAFGGIGSSGQAYQFQLAYDNTSNPATNPPRVWIRRATSVGAFSGAWQRLALAGDVPPVDSALDANSVNPVQNKVVKAALDAKADASDLDEKQNKVTEVTVATGGAVTQALEPGKIYHFTGSLTALTLAFATFITAHPVDCVAPAGGTATFSVAAIGDGLTYLWQGLENGQWTDTTFATSRTNTLSMNATAARDGRQYRCVVTDQNGNQVISRPATMILGSQESGGANTASPMLVQYHFDFTTGATAPTLTLPDSVIMPDGFSVEANKRYEVDILNNYGAVMAWAIS